MAGCRRAARRPAGPRTSTGSRSPPERELWWEPLQAPAGRGAISYFLVSGGRRYALASQSVAAMLGYDLSTQAVQLPAGVVDLIPSGPALDPAEATRPVASG